MRRIRLRIATTTLSLTVTSVVSAQPNAAPAPAPAPAHPETREAAACLETPPTEARGATCTPPPAAPVEATPAPSNGATAAAPGPQPVVPAPTPVQVYIQVQPSPPAAAVPPTPATQPPASGVVFPDQAQALPPHWLPPRVSDGTPEQRLAADRESREHRGLFGRMAVGLGYAWVGRGDLAPEPGFKPIDNLSFAGPALGVSLQSGVGWGNVALVGELSYERMLKSLEQPSPVSFQLFGLGLGGTYYFDNDWHLGAQLRLVGLLLWRRSIPCFWDRGDVTWGPGVGATFGKEWFGGDATGLGVSLQANYAHLQGTPNLRYASVLGQFTLTWF